MLYFIRKQNYGLTLEKRMVNGLLEESKSCHISNRTGKTKNPATDFLKIVHFYQRTQGNVNKIEVKAGTEGNGFKDFQEL